MVMASEVSSLVGAGTSVGPLRKPLIEDVGEFAVSRGAAGPADSPIPDDSAVMTKFPRDGSDSLFPSRAGEVLVLPLLDRWESGDFLPPSSFPGRYGGCHQRLWARAPHAQDGDLPVFVRHGALLVPFAIFLVSFEA